MLVSTKDILTRHYLNMAPNFDTIQPSLVQLNTNATIILTTGSDVTLGNLVITFG